MDSVCLWGGRGDGVRCKTIYCAKCLCVSQINIIVAKWRRIESGYQEIQHDNAERQSGANVVDNVGRIMVFAEVQAAVPQQAAGET